MDEAFIARFWSKVDKSGGPDACWPWIASMAGTGYGQFAVTVNGKTKPQRSHRLAWIITNGPIASTTIFVCHRCDNRTCCNPAHLFLGTAADNIADMNAKGRHGHTGVPGAAHPAAKLADDDVHAIRALGAIGVAGAAIARRFLVSTTTVNRIVSRELWRHLADGYVCSCHQTIP